MKRLQTLQLLLDKEQGLRDEAQAAHRAALKHLETQQQQGDGLTDYRVEYCRKWQSQFQQGAAMEILRAYHGFMSRLDQAIVQQTSVVAHARRNAEAARQRLVEREVRVATVERLIKRRRELLARMQDRRDQKNLDEMAARRGPHRDLVGLA